MEKIQKTIDAIDEIIGEPDFLNMEHSWAKSVDEKRRAFVFDRMVNPELDGHILVQNMEMVDRWLKSGNTELKLIKNVRLGSL